jgi:transposase-like protein
MNRSSNSEQAQRINIALELMKEYNSMAKAAAALAARFGISRSQAYRYVRKAEATGKEVPVPDPKVPFTIKLSQDLIQKLRRYAGSTGKSLSEIVTQALEAFLHGIHGRG